ncbi:hypothetical protein [Fundidesulfovibrio soli]|uniref:hypothetical protein n=1 Tax=Fundidesulfovibrio soli TaxID=2922716 RepID=UPI001FAEE58F|nr:hypothetical protein [Fundidesulfovibrio soli]
MASIRERIETVFAALAFAEQDQDREALEIMAAQRGRKAAATRRTDNRPRVRV